MKKGQGFTIVELIIVIVVIAILATIGMVGYSQMQKGAMDARIRATADQVGKAISSHLLKSGKPIQDGYFHQPTSSDRVNVDTAMRPYAGGTYREGLTSDNVRYPIGVFKFSNCHKGGFAIFASLNRPSSEDARKYQAAIDSCQPTASPTVPGYTYNYGQYYQ